MEMLAQASTARHTTFALTTTRPTEFVDLTDQLHELVMDAGFRFGFVNIQSLHTTTAVVVNEHEPLLLSDFNTVLARVAPSGGYRHDDATVRTVNVVGEERPNGHAHCRALLLPSSACLNIVEGRLHLGRWQRVFLVELDGPRPREISVLIRGEG